MGRSVVEQPVDRYSDFSIVEDQRKEPSEASQPNYLRTDCLRCGMADAGGHSWQGRTVPYCRGDFEDTAAFFNP